MMIIMANRKKPKVHLTVSVSQEAWETVDDFAFERHCTTSNAVEQLIKLAKIYLDLLEQQEIEKKKQLMQKQTK